MTILGRRSYGSDLSQSDIDLVIECVRERQRLRRELMELSDRRLAEKFGVPKNIMRAISREAGEK